MDIDVLTAKLAKSLNNMNDEYIEFDSLVPDDLDYMISSPIPMGYTSTKEQYYLMQNLLIGYSPDQSILDIGCGRGDLKFLIQNFYDRSIIWSGIDHNPIMKDLAKQKYDQDIILGPFETTKLYNHDWVVACNLFTQKRNNTDELDVQKLIEDVDILYQLANYTVSFNLLSSINTNKHDGFFYTDPGIILNILIKKYQNVIIRHNYSNDVYTILIYKLL